jgi:hypothetical protein
VGDKFIKKLNHIFIGSLYSIDLKGYRTSEIRESKKMGYYVSDFLKKRNHQLRNRSVYEKKI